MAAVTLEVKGGAKMDRILTEMEAKLGSGALVRVGFLEGATYPSKAGKPALHVATVAFWQEYGTMRKIGALGLRRVQHIPPRPFFRTMIREKSPGWGRSMGRIAVQQNYNAEKTLSLMGRGIQAQLQHSINQWTSPPNADATIKKKGFDKPLIETALMLRSVDFQVLLGSARP